MSIFGLKIKEKKIVNNVKENYIKVSNIEILGQWYSVEITFLNINAVDVNFNEKNIRIAFPLKYKNQNVGKNLNLVIYKIYEKIAKEQSEIILEKIRAKLKFAPEDYKFSYIKDSMAKCKGGEIIINPYIMKYDIETVKYLILHEYCHLRYKRHCKGFWTLMEKVMPTYLKYEMAA